MMRTLLALAFLAACGSNDETATPPPTSDLDAASLDVAVDRPAPDVVSPAHDADASSPFVRVCGTSLCLGEAPFIVHGATTYGQLDDPDAEVQSAKDAKLNTLEIVQFETLYHDLSDTMSEATWTRVDAMIAAASRANLKIVLNLSSYGQSLQNAAQKPTTTDWSPYLSFITSRVNTVSHVEYAADPTIALFLVFGEIDAPNYSAPYRGTTKETVDFYARTLKQLRALAPNHVVSTGGFSYLNDPGSGIDWKTIMSGADDDLCDVEINAKGDRDTTIPLVTAYCQALGKPWFLAAWSSCLDDKRFASDMDGYASDAEMAAHARDMYSIARATNVTGPAPTYAAVGTDFWNLGTKTAKPTCDIGPGFPATLAVVKEFAP
jgi:hypothetical protein